MVAPTLLYGKKKGKAIPITDPCGLEGSVRLRFTRHMKVVRSSPLRTGRLYPPGISWYSFLEAQSTPGHMEMNRNEYQEYFLWGEG
jgi:hypothetical protein